MEWRMLRRMETKLFVVFVLVYLLFAKWEGWNEQSRFALAESITFRNSLDIDPYANYTGDRSVYDGHYYSDKAPGTSVFAAPLIDTTSGIAGGQPDPQPPFLEDVQFNATIYTPLHVPGVESAERLLCIFFLSALPGALLVVLVYKASLLLTKDGVKSLVVAASFGLGSLIFPYSTILMGNVLAAFVSFLGFYVMLKHSGDADGRKQMLLAGALLAFASFIDYLSLLVALGGVAFMILKKARFGALAWFFAGLALGTLPLVAYNTAIFSNPVRFASSYIDPAIALCYVGSLASCPGTGIDFFQSATLELPMSLAKITVLPYRGLLFYSPFLLAAMAGFYWLHRSDAALARALLLAALLFVLFLAYYTYWFAGATFGLRYAFAYVPFLSLPTAAFLQRFWHKRLAKAVFSTLVAISVFHSFLAFAAPWEGFDVRFKDGKITGSVFWNKDFRAECTPSCTAANFLNPLYDYYLPAFLSNGAVSLAVYGVPYGKLDLSHTLPPPTMSIGIAATQAGFIMMNMRYIPLAIVAFVFVASFGAELSRIRAWKTSARTLLAAVCIAIALSSLSLSALAYDGNWYDASVDGYMSLESEASVRFISPGGSYVLNVTANNHEHVPVGVYLNGERVGEFATQDALILLADVKTGENKLTFRLAESCDAPLCFGLVRMDVIKEGDLLTTMAANGNGYAFGKGWYGRDECGRWSDGDSELYLLAANGGISTLNISAQSYRTPRLLQVEVNGDYVGSYYIGNETSDVVTDRFYLAPGGNVVGISTASCGVPLAIEGIPDNRCLSFLLRNMTVATSSLEYEKFFPQETSDSIQFRWFGDSGKIYFSNDRTGLYRLKFDAWISNPLKPMTMYLDGVPMNPVEATPVRKHFESPFVYLSTGLHSLEFRVGACSYLQNDTRCLGAAIGNFTVTGASNLLESINSEFDSGWYELETYNNTEFRWANGDATVSGFNPQNTVAEINISGLAWSYYRTRALSIELNGRELFKKYVLREEPVAVVLQLRPGTNEILFHSTGCDVPRDVERSDDPRCLSFAFADLELE